MARRGHYHVYVVELAKQVLDEPRFMKANPGYQAGKPCVYVGMTGVDPDVRFDKHKAGIQANRYVQRFGLRLLPEIYAATTRCRTMPRVIWRSNLRSTCAKAGTACGRLDYASLVDTLRRPLFVKPCFTLASTRRRCEPRVGFVARRGSGTTAASSTSCCSRASASSRFRSWLR
jgi:hypothetical protein